MVPKYFKKVVKCGKSTISEFSGKTFRFWNFYLNRGEEWRRFEFPVVFVTHEPTKKFWLDARKEFKFENGAVISFSYLFTSDYLFSVENASSSYITWRINHVPKNKINYPSWVQTPINYELMKSWSISNSWLRAFQMKTRR